MSLAEQARQTDIRLYHAYRAAGNCEDVMMRYYGTDYDVSFEAEKHRESSDLSVEESPELIKLGPDKLCNRIAREYLTMLYPDYGFVGEESFDEREMRKELFWCVDPICGSMGFKKQTGFFGTSVALIDRGRGPVIGALNCPAQKIGGIASLDQNTAAYAGTTEETVSGGLRVLISANRKNSEPFKQMLDLLNPSFIGYQESVPTKSLSVLMGAYDLHFNLPLDYQGGAPKIYDLAASQVFYRVEGMPLTDMSGNPLDLTGQAGYRYPDGYVMAKDGETLDRCLEAFDKML